MELEALENLCGTTRGSLRIFVELLDAFEGLCGTPGGPQGPLWNSEAFVELLEGLCGTPGDPRGSLWNSWRPLRTYVELLEGLCGSLWNFWRPSRAFVELLEALEGLCGSPQEPSISERAIDFRHRNRLPKPPHWRTVKMQKP